MRSRYTKNLKQVSVGTTMHPGSGLMVAEEEKEEVVVEVVVVVVVVVVGVVGSIDSPNEAWGCLNSGATSGDGCHGKR